MSVSFGVRPQSSSPVARKIERQAAAREKQRARAMGMEERLVRRSARRRWRGMVAKRELRRHRREEAP